MSTPPTPYNRSYNFEDFQSINPNSPLPAQHLENELNNIEETLDKTVSRLAEVQNPDGSIKITGNIEQNITNTATSVATSVANEVAADYLAANFDATAATTATTAAQAAASSATQSASSAQLAGLHANYAEQATLAAQQRANDAAASRNQAADSADEANLSKIAAKNSENNAKDYQDATAGLYMSTLGLKGTIDSNLGKVVYKREDVNHLGANILFNGGDISNTLIEKIFPGTSFNSNAQLQQGQTIDNIGFNHVHGPWWVVGNAQPENPSDIITRDMMNCLVQTWKYWGPSVANGQMKPMSVGINGEPNYQWHSLEYPQNIIQGIRYDQPDFNTNQMYPSQYADGVLTPWFVVQHKFNQAYSLAQTADSKADAALAQGGTLQAAIDAAKIQEYDNFRIYVIGDIVLQNNKIYRFNATIGAAGYGPSTHPSAWTEQSAAPSLAAYATTAALTSGLAGKANSSHTHTIANVTGLQAELNLKSSTSHNHDISNLTGLTSYFSPYQKRTLPVVYGNYAQEFAVNSPGSLHILDYATDSNGKVSFYSGSIGDRFFLYQNANAEYPIQLLGAINIDNKTFTRGAKSYVEAVSTPDGIVVSGDLMFPPNGTLLSSSCDYVDNMTDASGTANWSGNFYSNNVYATGDGGTYSSGGYNQNGCWYPMGFAISWGVNLSESTLSWNGCGNSGTYTYSQGYGNILADGAGGTTQQYTGGWSANSGDVIYDGGSCLVKYDGMGGYYVEDNSGSGSYGTYLGNFGGTSQFTYYDSSSNPYNFDSYYWSEDRYSDGMGSYYTANYNSNYVSYGTYLGYNYTDGISVYADGNGSYYTY